MNTYFTPNEGLPDRVIRAIIAIIAIVVATQTTGNLKLVMSILGVIMMVTAITGFCGLYKLLGIQTCPRKHTHHHEESHGDETQVT